MNNKDLKNKIKKYLLGSKIFSRKDRTVSYTLKNNNYIFLSHSFVDRAENTFAVYELDYGKENIDSSYKVTKENIKNFYDDLVKDLHIKPSKIWLKEYSMDDPEEGIDKFLEFYENSNKNLVFE